MRVAEMASTDTSTGHTYREMKLQHGRRGNIFTSFADLTQWRLRGCICTVFTHSTVRYDDLQGFASCWPRPQAPDMPPCHTTHSVMWFFSNVSSQNIFWFRVTTAHQSGWGQMFPRHRDHLNSVDAENLPSGRESSVRVASSGCGSVQCPTFTQVSE